VCDIPPRASDRYMDPIPYLSPLGHRHDAIHLVLARLVTLIAYASRRAEHYAPRNELLEFEKKKTPP